MLSVIGSYVASGILLFASVEGVQEHYTIIEINGMVAVANKHYFRGVEIHNEARPKFEAFEQAVPLFPDNRAELERRGRELAELYRRDAEQYRLAAAKFGEAAVKSFDIDVKNYFRAKQIRFAKSAEIRDLLQAYLHLAADPALLTADDFATLRAEFDARALVLCQEETDLEAAAETIVAEHRWKFK
jgi:hypothetical protein